MSAGSDSPDDGSPTRATNVSDGVDVWPPVSVPLHQTNRAIREGTWCVLVETVSQHDLSVKYAGPQSSFVRAERTGTGDFRVVAGREADHPPMFAFRRDVESLDAVAATLAEVLEAVHPGPVPFSNPLPAAKRASDPGDIPALCGWIFEGGAADRHLWTWTNPNRDHGDTLQLTPVEHGTATWRIVPDAGSNRSYTDRTTAYRALALHMAQRPAPTGWQDRSPDDG